MLLLLCLRNISTFSGYLYNNNNQSLYKGLRSKVEILDNFFEINVSSIHNKNFKLMIKSQIISNDQMISTFKLDGVTKNVTFNLINSESKSHIIGKSNDNLTTFLYSLKDNFILSSNVFTAIFSRRKYNFPIYNILELIKYFLWGVCWTSFLLYIVFWTKKNIFRK